MIAKLLNNGSAENENRQTKCVARTAKEDMKTMEED